MEPKFIESMTQRVELDGSKYRVWRGESEIDLVYPETITDIGNVLLECTDVRRRLEGLLALDRVTTVEYTNLHGCGVVLYKEWPG